MRKRVLVAAKQLVAIDGIDVVDDIKDVTYYHFLCNQHEIVFANGVQTESLYTGPQAMKSLSKEARDEVLMIFPELAEIEYKALHARTAAIGCQGRNLAFRHKKNAKTAGCVLRGDAVWPSNSSQMRMMRFCFDVSDRQ